MGDNFEKTKEILAGAKGPTATALKAMAMDLDTKFTELDKRNEERHNSILEALRCSKLETEARIKMLEDSTNERFSKLKVVMFFSENWKLLLIVIIAFLIVLGLISSEDSLSIFKNLK